jgi:hypothetical protein
MAMPIVSSTVAPSLTIPFTDGRCRDSGCLDRLEEVGLARSREAASFLADIDRLAKRQLQPIEVELATFGADLREETQELRYLVGRDVL